MSIMRDEPITVKFTEEEVGIIERAARKEKITVSAFIRKCIMIDHMKEWDHSAMMVVRSKIEADIRAALEEHLPAMVEEKRKRA